MLKYISIIKLCLLTPRCCPSLVPLSFFLDLCICIFLSLSLSSLFLISILVKSVLFNTRFYGRVNYYLPFYMCPFSPLICSQIYLKLWSHGRVKITGEGGQLINLLLHWVKASSLMTICLVYVALVCGLCLFVCACM